MTNPLSPTSGTQQQLVELAKFLLLQRAEILKIWRQVADDDPQLTSSSPLSRQQFENNIPHVLDALGNRLRIWPEPLSSTQAQKETQASQAHAAHRWQQGYDLRSLVREWSHLHTVLSDFFDDYAAQNRPLAETVAHASRKILADLFLENMSEGIAQYGDLLQSEAAVRVRELQTMLENIRVLEQQRAQLLREATHDLRGSLGLVKGAASLMDWRQLTEEQRSQVFEMLQTGVSSLHEMLSELMDMARLEAGHETAEIAPFDAAQLLAELGGNARSLALEKSLDWNCQGPDSLEVEGDATKIERIAQNLVLNAIKYTEAGRVEMEWGEENATQWFLEVRDTGPGFAGQSAAPLAHKLGEATKVARQDDLPNPKAPTSAPSAHNRRGEGIGLAIVKRLCELLDAGLKLDSQAGQGTTVRVSFPRRYPKKPVSSL